MHHGGAGTTGASLGAGLPTIIKPFFGDQHFWRVPFTILLSFRPVNATWQTASPFTRSKLTGRALRVTKLGVGLKATSFRASDMATALKKVTTDTVMREKAARVGRAIRRENGVDNALEAIHFNIVRAAADRGSLRFNK
jgi:sterol 3beta-glucosyltransferase